MCDPLEVPCLATEPYDGGDFEDFPNRKGWGSRPIQEWHNIFKAPSRDFSGFLQTWLYFGPIEVVFGRRTSLESFTRRGRSGQLIVNASLLKEWFRLRPKFYPRSHEDKAKILKALVCACNIHYSLALKRLQIDDPESEPTLENFIRMATLNDPRDPAIVVSISLLLETLSEYIFSGMDGFRNSYIKGVWGGAALLSPWGNILSERMRASGWCPSEIDIIFRRLNCAGIYFMSHLSRPNAHRHHKMIRIHPHPSSHKKGIAASDRTESSLDTSDRLCTREKCSFLQLNDEGYETKHAEGCTKSSCYDMVADQRQVLEILRAGSIPLILSIDSSDDSRDLTLVPSGPDFELSYVAISHVWSDGMGNVQRSALPRCQILRLSNLMRSLPSKASDIVLFWIDTIGCPPDVAGQNEAQELAISMMRQTYENARAVLVLDSWLQTCRIDSIPHHEVLMMIISSAWNSRLWTLQEGALAKELFFQFADHVYNIDGGLVSFNNIDDPVLAFSLQSPISERVHEIRGFVHAETALGPKLNALRAALCFRSTSVETDEALCLAALLNLHKSGTTAVIQAPPKDRMRTFWSLLGKVPAEIIFNDHARLKVNGYRWAPRTLLRDPANQAVSNVMARTLSLPEAKRTSGGLLYQGPGLVMYAGKHSIGSYFYARDENERVYKFSCSTREAENAVECDTTQTYANSVQTNYHHDDIFGSEDPNHSMDYTVNPSEAYNSEVICVMFPFDLNQEISVGRQAARGGPAIFLSWKYKLHGVIYVRRLFSGVHRQLQVGVHDGELGKLPRIPIQQPTGMFDEPGEMVLSKGNAYYPDGRLLMVGARSLGPEQYWCVD